MTEGVKPDRIVQMKVCTYCGQPTGSAKRHCRKWSCMLKYAQDKGAAKDTAQGIIHIGEALDPEGLVTKR